MNKLSASCIREELIRFGLDHSLEYLSADEKDQNHLFALQRHLRGNTVGQFLIHQKREGVQIVPGLPVGTGNVLSELAHYANFARARKATQRQNRTIAIEERKRKEQEDKKKKKQGEFLRLVLDHREKFLSFHKENKAGVWSPADGRRRWRGPCADACLTLTSACAVAVVVVL